MKGAYYHSFMHGTVEPEEKMSGVAEEKVIESISIADGVIKSTVDDILEVSRNVRCSKT